MPSQFGPQLRTCSPAAQGETHPQTLAHVTRKVHLQAVRPYQISNGLLLEQLDCGLGLEAGLILATSRYLGESFAEVRLDAMFLTLPFPWPGTLAQYAGRLHRDYHDKREVIIYDYLDKHVPMWHKMYNKRSPGYATLGYELKGCQQQIWRPETARSSKEIV